MSFASLGEFLAMGGHGLYVWLAYGATLLVVVANVVSVRLAWRRRLRHISALHSRAEVSSTLSSERSAN